MGTRSLKQDVKLKINLNYSKVLFLLVKDAQKEVMKILIEEKTRRIRRNPKQLKQTTPTQKRGKNNMKK